MHISDDAERKSGLNRKMFTLFFIFSIDYLSIISILLYLVIDVLYYEYLLLMSND